MTEALTNDTRQEANTALLEVDKGLRSSRVGEQCEAIVKFPTLVGRFPFPILINAAFLKLADVFRTGTNLLRMNVLKVVQQSECHLNKITSVDEFLRRIFSVIHSNDPIARAITLRVFGSIASIIAERKNVHHSIHHSLDSNDRVEVEAAIFATSCLCQHSCTFAAGVCEKIASMVQGLTTPVEMKLKLIPILTRMHHDISTATQVRDLCVKLLPSYPSLSFVTAILHTLTELAIATVVHMVDQVRLLLSYAQADSRKLVRFTALRELLQTVSKVPHTWTKEMIEGTLSVVEKAINLREKEMAFSVLLRLSASLAVHNMTSLKDSLLPYYYSSNSSIAAYSLGVATNITMATSRGAEDGDVEVERVGSLVVESLLMMGIDDQEGSKTALKVSLSSLVKLSANSEVSKSALDTLLSILPLLSAPQAALVCGALVSIATHTPDSWSHATPRLMEYLEAKTDSYHRVLLPIATVLMQLHDGVCSAPQRHSFHSSTLPTLLTHLWAMAHPSQYWVGYKIARRASMMGFHELAEPIYFKLSKLVTTVKFHNWLRTLHQFSVAQTVLSSSHPHTSDVIPALCKASAIVYNAMMLTKASSPPSSFPLNFLSAHAALLDAHSHLLSTCVSLHTSPPPTLSVGNSLEQKFQLCMSQFQSLSEQYSSLYSSLFDADPPTLEYVTLPGKVSTPMAATPSAPVEISDNFNTRYLLGRACRDVLQHGQVAASSLQSLPLSEQHASVLTECSKMLLQVPFRLPQYFFVSLQQTSVKLALSPPLPPSGQQVMVNLNTHLTLKVEGVIGHAGKTRVYRSPAAVYVQVMPQLEKALTSDPKCPGLQQLEKTEVVEKDYFQAQFLLTLPLPGYYNIRISASLLDEEGTMWHTGPKTSMSVLVDSEENFTLKQQQRQKEAAMQTAKSSMHAHRV